MTKQQWCHDENQNYQTEVQLTLHHNSKKKENNEEQQNHLQYERLGSCHNIWACPSIMSSLSTESAHNWGFIRIKEMAMIVN